MDDLFSNSRCEIRHFSPNSTLQIVQVHCICLQYTLQIVHGVQEKMQEMHKKCRFQRRIGIYLA